MIADSQVYIVWRISKVYNEGEQFFQLRSAHHWSINRTWKPNEWIKSQKPENAAAHTFEMLNDCYWDVMIADKCWKTSSNCFSSEDQHMILALSDRWALSEWFSKRCSKKEYERPGTEHSRNVNESCCFHLFDWFGCRFNENQQSRASRLTIEQIYDVNRPLRRNLIYRDSFM